MGTVVIRDDFIEEFWLCTCCKTICPGVSGSERESLTCTKCGHKKEDSDPWVPNPNPDTAPALTGEKEEYAKRGGNIHCPACKAESREGSLTCEVCGEPLGVVLEGTSFFSNWSKGSVDPPKTPLVTPRPAAKSKGVARDKVTKHLTTWVDRVTTFALWMALCGVVVGGVGLFVWLTTDHTTVVRVDQTRWTRRQILHERHDYSGEGWQGPSAASHEVFSWDACMPRQNGTYTCNPYQCHPRTVEDPTRCTGGGTRPCRCAQVPETYNCRDVVDRSNCTTSIQSRGNGSARRTTTCATRSVCDRRMVQRCESCAIPRVCQMKVVYETCTHQCPRMDTWCRYRYHQWDIIQDQTISGNDHNQRWPGLIQRGPNQRLEGHQTYAVVFRGVNDPSQIWTKTLIESDFSHYQIGDRWVAQWSRGGSFFPTHPLTTDGGR